MNQVYLDEKGKLFINGNEIKEVVSVASKTSFTGTNLVIELTGDFKSDYQSEKKVHSLDECTKV